jgi:hypothetical protein
LLAVAGLGVLLLARFNQVLDGRLSDLSLSSALASAVAAERNKLGGADFSALDPLARGAIREAFDVAYVAAFRAVMIAGAFLAALGAFAGLLLVEPGQKPSGTPHRDRWFSAPARSIHQQFVRRRTTRR